MVSKIERSLEVIANKARLREWVDAMPEDAEGIILLSVPETETSNESYKFYHVGEVNVTGAVWLMETFKLFLMGCLQETD